MKKIAIYARPICAKALFCIVFSNLAVAHAQPAAYPSKAIRLTAPFTPGGSTNIMARAIGQELTKAWGQSVIVDIVPGAGGAVGADKVAKAPAGGNTL